MPTTSRAPPRQPATAADRHPGDASVRLSALWRWLSYTAAGLAALSSLAGFVFVDAVYGQETTALTDAAAAHDAINLMLVAPLLVILGIKASRGSLTAYLSWLGCLAFSAYNYAIFSFSVHFGPLFLVWIAVFGLSVFTFVGGLAMLNVAAVERRYVGRGQPVVAWLLIAAAALFALLWLGEIVPELLSGAPSRSATTWGVPTNPVPVLDLAFFLPAVAVSGILLLRRHPLGYATAPGQLVFLALTCLPILVNPLVATARGHEPRWAVTLPAGIVFVAVTIALVRTLRSAGHANRTGIGNAW
jgi:hypothetical protein